jgi:hypothetical protein
MIFGTEEKNSITPFHGYRKRRLKEYNITIETKTHQSALGPCGG